MTVQYTDEQKAIFHFVANEQSHGIIDAVAGSGKTTTIMECTRYVPKGNKVLFCAFNNSIAGEIEKKFKEKGIHDVIVKTIHALGRQILVANNNTGKTVELEDKKYDRILKSEETQESLRPIYRKILRINQLDFEDELDERKKYTVKGIITRFNERLLELNQKFRSTLTKDNTDDFEIMAIHFGVFNAIDIAAKHFKEEIGLYFDAHQLLLDTGNDFSAKTMVIDFTDMLYLPYKWTLQPTEKFDFLFIDECQDLSMSQFAVATKFAKKGGRILAVGDPWQSIYGFTGADIESFTRVRDYTRATPLHLTQCFRCPRKIIALAQIIRKDISAAKTEDGNVVTIQFDEVIKLAVPGDLIISRLRIPIVLMVFKFIDKNIKVQIHRDEVNEIINEIKNIFYQNELNMIIADLPDNFETLKDEILRKRKPAIKKNAERIADSIERRLYIENETSYLEQKLEFLHKKYEQWNTECRTIFDLLKKVRTYISATDNSIRLSTIHRAKGLENDRVFILNYDELPFSRLNQKEWEKVQELNLKYVALTRAKKELFLIETKKQNTIEEEGSLFDELPFN